MRLIDADELKTAFPCGEYIRTESVRATIDHMPSAEPERWSTCFDCPLSHGCPVINGCTNEQAMQYVGDIPDDCPLNKISAELERKKGKWIFIHPLQKDDPGSYMCSVCEYGDWDIKPTDKYCKFCGADMRGE